MNKFACRSALALAFVAILAGCSGKPAFEPAQQSGDNPPLPQAQNFLVPPMQVPTGVGWAQGQAPKVAAGLKIEKIASSLMHPRQLLRTPQRRRAGGGIQWPGNRAGDDPEAIDRRQGQEPLGQGRQGRQPDHAAAQEHRCRWRMGEARLRRTPALAVRRAADRRLPVRRQHRRHREVSLQRRGNADHGARRGIRGPAGHHQSPLDQGIAGEPGRHQAVCRRRLQQQHHRERTGRGIPARGRARGGRGHWRQPDLRVGPAQSDRAPMGAADRQALGHRQRTRRDRRGPGTGLHDLGPGRRLLRMAVQLFWPARGQPRHAASAPTWSARRSSRITRWGRMSPRSDCCSQPTTPCPRNFTAAHSSASTAAGTVHH